MQCKEQGDAVDREISSFQAVCGAEHVVQLLDYTYHETSSTDKMAYLLFPLLKVVSLKNSIHFQTDLSLLYKFYELLEYMGESILRILISPEFVLGNHPHLRVAGLFCSI